MASKMPVARDRDDQSINIALAEQSQYTKPLRCEHCEATVSFVGAYPRNVGDDIIVVDPFFRLNPGQRHSEGCRYNVHGQVKIIASTSESDVIAAIQSNRYELRLLAVRKALVELHEQARKKRTFDSGDRATPDDKVYVDGGKKLGAYINSAKRVLQVRAACEAHSEIEEVLQLVFEGVRVHWRDFYFEDDGYFACFHQVADATVAVPIAVRGTVKRVGVVKDSFAVLDLVRPSRRTDRADVLDMACLSIWSPDLDAFKPYAPGQDILAFGLWQSGGVKESENKKANSPIRLFRNHELRLWPVTASQVCRAKN